MADKKDEKEKGAGAVGHGARDHAGGKVVTYRATAGYRAMKDAKTERTKANRFFVAYTKLGTETAKAIRRSARSRLRSTAARAPRPSGCTWAPSGRSGSG